MPPDGLQSTPSPAHDQPDTEHSPTPVPDSASRKEDEPKADGRPEPKPEQKADGRGAQGGKGEDTAAAKAPKTPLSKGKKLALIAGAAALVLGGTAYWYHGTFFEDTDDAQVDGYISSVSSRVSGTVTGVLIDDDQTVNVNQVLVELDPTDLRVTREQAKAALAQAEAQLRADQSNATVTETSNDTLVSTSSSDVASGQADVAEAQQSVAQAEALVKQAEADAKLAQTEQARSAQLFASGAIARAEFDSRTAAADAAAAKLQAAREGRIAAHRRVDAEAAKAHAASSRLQEAKDNGPDVLNAKRATVELRKASVDAARAALEQAELNVGYAVIKAPVKGIVGKRSVNVGDRVNAGQALMGITQIDKLWITANFRETQVQHMHVGQSVTVHVDAVGLDFDGVLQSMAAATGSRYSVLPPENASGNYVKVVQRLPARIRLLPKQAGLELLRPGMSAEPKVRVK
ncbi:MAG: HlyD family secretion protein [Polyangiaceae bacterium]